MDDADGCAQGCVCPSSLPGSGAPSSTGACDLSQPYGTPDSSDVQAAINMTLGVSPCTANIIGTGLCNVVMVQRVVNAALPGGTCVTGSGSGGGGPVSHSVVLNWSASPTPSVTYKVYRSTTAGVYSTPLASSISTTSYTDGTVQSGTTYYYVVTAVNSGGESARSNESPAAIPVPYKRNGSYPKSVISVRRAAAAGRSSDRWPR